MMYPILYKRNVDGSVQTWRLEREGNRYRTHSSRLGGIIVTSDWREVSATNEGKTNARNPEEQAEFAVESIYKRRLERAYSETLEGVDKVTFFQPMLAKSWNGKDEKIFKNNTIFSQPKLDGIRAIITSDGIASRNGKEIVSCPHIFEAFEKLFKIHPDLVIDGELYNHEFKDDFNSIVSLVRKQNVTDEDHEKTRNLIEFHWYDIVSEESFLHRSLFIHQTIGMKLVPECIRLVKTDKVNSVDEALELYASYVEEGYEGQMLRIGESSYEHKRSSALLKHKSFDDTEFKLLEVCEGLGNRSGKAGYLICELPDGRTFRSGIAGTHEFSTNLLEDRMMYQNGVVTIQHFGYTPDGIPRFPVAVKFYPQKRDL